jgi:outer membrane protein assembly factor BamB
MKKNLIVLAGVLIPGLFILCACDKKPKEPLQGIREAVFTDLSTIKVDRPGAQVTLPEAQVNQAWPVAGCTPSHVACPAALEAAPREVWRVRLGVGSSATTRLLNGPIIAENKAFAIDAEGIVSAVNLENGEVLWQTPTLPEKEAAQPFGGGIAYDEGMVFVASAAAEVLALDAKSGTIRWRQKISAPVRSAPTVKDGRIYVVTINNQLEALNIKNGDVLWSHSGTIEIAGLLGGASPALDNGVVVVPYTSGEVFALRVENGYPLWSESFGSVHALDSVAALSHIKARPVIHRHRVIIISHGGRMSALDLRNGQTIWTKEIAGIRSPAVIGNYIFLVTMDSQLVCLDQDKGDVLWVQSLPQYAQDKGSKERILWAGPILTAQGLVLAGSQGQAIFCAPQNGKIVHTIDLGSPTLLSPVIAQKTLLFFTEDAELIAYR